MLFLQVILGLLMLATPFFIIFRYRLNILKKTVLALLKLSVMMILTAIFLQYLFEWNSVTANFMWILLMIGISAVGILRNRMSSVAVSDSSTKTSGRRKILANESMSTRRVASSIVSKSIS